MMRCVSVALLVFVAGRTCSAQGLQPCTAPPMFQGSFTVAPNDKIGTLLGNYVYDSVGQRIRYQAIDHLSDKTCYTDALLLFQEGVMYLINEKTRTCKRHQLRALFHPLKIPNSAKFVSQVVLGTFSTPGAGMLANVWFGEIPEEEVEYVCTVTEVDCIPVSCLTKAQKSEGMATSFYNTVIGIENPEVLLPPSYCENAPLENEKKDFYSILS